MLLRIGQIRIYGAASEAYWACIVSEVISIANSGPLCQRKPSIGVFLSRHLHVTIRLSSKVNKQMQMPLKKCFNP